MRIHLHFAIFVDPASHLACDLLCMYVFILEKAIQEFKGFGKAILFVHLIYPHDHDLSHFLLKRRKSLEGLVTVRFFEIKSDVHVYNEIT